MMARPGRLPAPGTEYGPCPEGCEHRDCAATRRQAEQDCRLCGNPVGYDTGYYVDPEGKGPEDFVHSECLLNATDDPYL